MTQQNEQAFVEQIKRRLDRQANELDELTVGRLGAARQRAVDAVSRPKQSWIPAIGIATATVVVFAVAVWQNPSDLPGPYEELDIIASGEDLELIEDLDFYDWLDATQAAS